MLVNPRVRGGGGGDVCDLCDIVLVLGKRGEELRCKMEVTIDLQVSAPRH